ncbi:MAG TPA: amidase family protein [Acidimicrobiia bacterium]|nr:amidase family protein [Acidimicrobiia bacterium]
MADLLRDHDASGLAALVRAGEVTPLELVDAVIERIELVDPQLNAVIHPRFERARAEAAALDSRNHPGAFAGVPFLVKDITCHQAGEPHHEGMRFLRDRQWVADTDTYLAARFKAAGLVTVGRTNAPELGLVPTTEPEAYGATRNPWDPSRSPGGSSGGSAAAVAAGLVPAAHANDGGGSIRIPASACGLVGLKPSRGRTSLGPDASFSALVVCEHVVCRTVRDTAAFLDAAAGPMPGDPWVAPPPVRPYSAEVGADPGRLRIGLMTAAPGGLAVVAPECVTAAEDAAHSLEDLGHRLEAAHPAALDLPEWAPHFMSLWSAGVALGLDAWSTATGSPIGAADVEPLTWALAELARGLPTPVLLRALDWLLQTTRLVHEWWAPPGPGGTAAAGFDLLLTPTLAEPPVPLGTFAAPPDNPLAGFMRAAAFTPFTPPFNVTGQPAISLPLHRTADGLPVGVQLVAAYGREDLLIRVAAQLEESFPWDNVRAPISAGG